MADNTTNPHRSESLLRREYRKSQSGSGQPPANQAAGTSAVIAHSTKKPRVPKKPEGWQETGPHERNERKSHWEGWKNPRNEEELDYEKGLRREIYQKSAPIPLDLKTTEGGSKPRWLSKRAEYLGVDADGASWWADGKVDSGEGMVVKTKEPSAIANLMVDAAAFSNPQAELANKILHNKSVMSDAEELIKQAYVITENASLISPRVSFAEKVSLARELLNNLVKQDKEMRELAQQVSDRGIHEIYPISKPEIHEITDNEIEANKEVDYEMACLELGLDPDQASLEDARKAYLERKQEVQQLLDEARPGDYTEDEINNLINEIKENPNIQLTSEEEAYLDLRQRQLVSHQDAYLAYLDIKRVQTERLAEACELLGIDQDASYEEALAALKKRDANIAQQIENLPEDMGDVEVAFQAGGRDVYMAFSTFRRISGKKPKVTPPPPPPEPEPIKDNYTLLGVSRYSTSEEILDAYTTKTKEIQDRLRQIRQTTDNREEQLKLTKELHQLQTALLYTRSQAPSGKDAFVSMDINPGATSEEIDLAYRFKYRSLSQALGKANLTSEDVRKLTEQRNQLDRAYVYAKVQALKLAPIADQKLRDDYLLLGVTPTTSLKDLNSAYLKKEWEIRAKQQTAKTQQERDVYEEELRELRKANMYLRSRAASVITPDQPVYNQLGVRKNATPAEIESAYKKRFTELTRQMSLTKSDSEFAELQRELNLLNIAHLTLTKPDSIDEDHLAPVPGKIRIYDNPDDDPAVNRFKVTGEAMVLKRVGEDPELIQATLYAFALAEGADTSEFKYLDIKSKTPEEIKAIWEKIYAREKDAWWDNWVDRFPEKAMAYASLNDDIKTALQRYYLRQDQKRAVAEAEEIVKASAAKKPEGEPTGGVPPSTPRGAPHATPPPPGAGGSAGGDGGPRGPSGPTTAGTQEPSGTRRTTAAAAAAAIGRIVTALFSGTGPLAVLLGNIATWLTEHGINNPKDAFLALVAVPIAAISFLYAGVFFVVGLVLAALIRLVIYIIIGIILIILLVSFILIIINSSAYITPQGGGGVRIGNDPGQPAVSEYISLTKTAQPNKFDNSNTASYTVIYTITIGAKKGTLSNIRITETCNVSQRGGGNPGCPNRQLVDGSGQTHTIPEPGDADYPTTISTQNGSKTFTYKRVFTAANYTDSLTTDTITVTADASEHAGATAAASASVTIGTPPMDCPNGWPVVGSSNQRYAIDQGPGGTATHSGPNPEDYLEAIDIAAQPYGREIANSDVVYATHTGLVAFAGPDNNTGLYVYIRGSCNNQTFASQHVHFSALYVKTGDQVTRGTPLGIMGNTGKANYPHDHYEFRENSSVTMANPFIPVTPPNNCTGVASCNISIP